jgi:hypothetical protein
MFQNKVYHAISPKVRERAFCEAAPLAIAFVEKNKLIISQINFTFADLPFLYQISQKI